MKSSWVSTIKGNVTWYAWGVDISSTTHNWDLTSNWEGKGSYSLINTVSLSILRLLAMRIWLEPKFSLKSTKYSASSLYWINSLVELRVSVISIWVLSNLISVLFELISLIKYLSEEEEANLFL